MKRAMNQPKAARSLISQCISFLVDGMDISSTTFTWFSLLRFLFESPKKLGNLLALMPNAHLSRLSFKLYFYIKPNAYSKC